MNPIISYHVVAPGDLWVRVESGQLRRATATEEITLLRMAPDLELEMGWRDMAPGSNAN